MGASPLPTPPHDTDRSCCAGVNAIAEGEGEKSMSLIRCVCVSVQVLVATEQTRSDRRNFQQKKTKKREEATLKNKLRGSRKKTNHATGLAGMCVNLMSLGWPRTRAGALLREKVSNLGVSSPHLQKRSTPRQVARCLLQSKLCDSQTAVCVCVSRMRFSGRAPEI